MKRVTVYALSTCPWCMKTKRYFTKKKIPFTCVDYDLVSDKEQERIMEIVTKHGGTGEFPFIIIGKDTVSGYDPEEFAKLLGIEK
jgi:glutaredoxin